MALRPGPRVAEATDLRQAAHAERLLPNTEQAHPTLDDRTRDKAVADGQPVDMQGKASRAHIPSRSTKTIRHDRNLAA